MADDIKLVYLVHSDSDVLLSLYDALSGAGFQVAASSNAFDGLSFLARAHPAAVLCRWDMPEIDGKEFIERVKRVSPETRILMCFRKWDERVHEHVLKLGGNGLIREPMSPSTVIRAISRMISPGVPYESLEAPASFDSASKEEWPNGKPIA